MRIPIGQRLQDRFWENVMPIPECGCWIWLKATHYKGYGELRFNGKKDKAHRVAYILANGNIPEGMQVLHHCDTPPCINPKHLFLGTNTDNAKDSVKKGRSHLNRLGRKGEEHPLALLNNHDIIEIRNSNLIGRDLAAKYGVCESEINFIKQGKRWKHIPGVRAISKKTQI